MLPRADVLRLLSLAPLVDVTGPEVVTIHLHLAGDRVEVEAADPAPPPVLDAQGDDGRRLYIDLMAFLAGLATSPEPVTLATAHRQLQQVARSHGAPWWDLGTVRVSPSRAAEQRAYRAAQDGRRKGS